MRTYIYAQQGALSLVSCKNRISEITINFFPTVVSQEKMMYNGFRRRDYGGKSIGRSQKMFLMYKDKFHETMDEMKMHKLMYFSQRESLIQHDVPLFEERFSGWRYGPVLPSVRGEFMKSSPFEDIDDSTSSDTATLIEEVLNRYGSISSWNLSVMSHEELSWKLARSGLELSENGTQQLSIDAIRLDAVRERLARRHLPTNPHH